MERKWRLPRLALLALALVTPGCPDGTALDPLPGDERPVERFAGRFVDARTGAGFAAVSLLCAVHRAGEARPTERRQIVVGDDGHFVVDRLPADAVELFLSPELPEPFMRVAVLAVRHEHAADEERRPGLDPDEEVEIPVVEGGVIEGHVEIDADLARPPETITALWDRVGFEAGMETEVQVRPDGAFRAARLPIDRPVRLLVRSVEDGAFLPAVSTARVGEAGIRIALARSLSIAGRVVGSAADLAGATVHAISDMPPLVRMGSVPGRAPVAADGRFEVAGLGPGVHRLVLRSAQRQTRAIGPLVAAGRRDAVIEVEPLVRLSGRVSGLAPETEADITIYCEEPGFYHDTVYTEAGAFDAEVPRGSSWTLMASDEYVREKSGAEGFLQGVVAPATSLTLSLAPAERLRAALRNARGPVFALAGRAGFTRGGWIWSGRSLDLGPLPAGSYEVQLLSYSQFYALAFSGFRALPDGLAPTVTLGTDRAEAVLDAP